MRLLVAEGNTREARAEHARTAGRTPGEFYRSVLAGLAEDATIDLVCPADADAALPEALDGYDGVAVTGSALNIHKREPESLRQIAFARAVYAAGVPFFGSCWGLQLATVAAGGDVRANPRGREVAFARRVWLADAGREHRLHAGRTMVFDAPAIHGDEVTALPEAAVVTAWNTVSRVQAATITVGRSTFWGVQYHPEYSLGEVAAIVLRYGQRLVDERFFPDLATLEAYARDLRALNADPSRRDIAWRYGLDEAVLDPAERLTEIRNWIEHQVRPSLSAR